VSAELAIRPSATWRRVFWWVVIKVMDEFNA